VHDDQVDAMTQALLRWLWAKPAVPDAADIAEERARERDLAEKRRKHDKAWARFKPKPVVRAGTGW
jgi:hypothetical protein